MKTLVAKLEEMRSPLINAIQRDAVDSHLAVGKLSVLDEVSRVVHGHISECAINFHGENVVVLGDLDSESGQCVTSPVTPEQVKDMHSAQLISVMVQPVVEMSAPALDRLGYLSQVQVMVEEIQKGDMSAVDLLSEMRDALVERYNGMGVFEITSSETKYFPPAIEEVETICDHLGIRLDPRQTEDEWCAEIDQVAGSPDFGQEVIASDFIHGILGISLEPREVDLQTLLDPVPEHQEDEMAGLCILQVEANPLGKLLGGLAVHDSEGVKEPEEPTDYAHQIYGCGINDVLGVIFTAMGGPIDPLRERYNELMDEKSDLEKALELLKGKGLGMHALSARTNIRHALKRINTDLAAIKQDL